MILFKCRGTTIRTSCLKLLILVSFALVVVLLLLLNGIFVAEEIRSRTPPTLHFPVAKSTLLSVTQEVAKTSVRAKVEVRTPTIRFRNRTVSSEINILREIVKLHNRREHTRNLDKFPDPVTEDTVVIVVQVHNRPDYFNHLVRSIGKANGIHNAILVISHDLYSDEMNKVVDSIDFCKVVQIFFPYSQQLYPEEFPGSDPNDCPRDTAKAKALEMKCNNAYNPDMYGHYREAKFTGTKHHWWWKINQVFDKLNITQHYNGPVLLLEEDHFVTPDFYHVLKLLHNSRKSYSECNQGCEILSLGAYNLVEDYKAAGANLVELVPWSSVTHNMGMAIDRETWLQLKNCEQMFCTYDDYNWDWTLMKISMSCMKQRLRALVVKSPRVFHVGACGLHHKDKDCNNEQTIAKFQRVIDKNTASFFPSSLTIQTGSSKVVNLGSPNGGWGDPRDHILCRQFVKR